MKILVVDDHALVREGLRQVLQGLPAPVEVIEAAHCAAAFELARSNPDLDLVLLDYHLPDMNGMQALDLLGRLHPELPVLMLSGSINPNMMRQVLAKGACGFLTKTGLSSEILAAVRVVLAGDIYLPAQLRAVSAHAGMEACASGQDLPVLTRRQEQVLYLLIDGRSNKDIGENLHLSEETIKTHVSAVMRAFGASTRLQAVTKAARFGYVKASSAR